ncbi:hypothetical protein [Allosphingosinicella indica]|uniref:Uncharacterized protein n=1 Tax=Allosphingosinicella indica TaxID=941907 RepID=A0A1X7H0S5_9SPHN|nr:hypothetical protein [Allosphingosinicella indica]SMF77448.1 hypothetical protein SAMN06295910_2591 [Allosphingosinicella indica]
MNRLSPLITRKTGRFAPALAMGLSMPPALEFAPEWQEDAQQFLTAWIGGMVFFLTFLS